MISNNSDNSKNTNPYKPQQNSYPFYAQNKQNPTRPESNYSEVGHKNISSMQSPYSTKTFNFQSKQQTNLNTSINNLAPSQYYRKS